MKSFEEIQKNSKNPIILKTVNGNAVTGTLRLGGSDTRIEIAREFGKWKYVDGFFSFSSTDAQGNSILFHKCITLQHTDVFATENSISESIFPNVVVFDSQNISEYMKVKRIAFQLEMFNDAFRYGFIESHSVISLSLDTKNKLLEIRRERIENAFFPMEYDFFDPQRIFISHAVNEVIAFECDGAKFSIQSGGKETAGVNKVSVETTYTASITWEYFVDLDEALTVVRHWICFFSQVAMQKLEPSKIALNADSSQNNASDVYIPSLADLKPTQQDSHFSGHSFPYNSWDERDKLGSLMASWLSKQRKRTEFRQLLNSVLSNLYVKNDIFDVVKLCAAVENINTDRKPRYKKSEISNFVDSVSMKAKKMNIKIERDRLSGILGQLNNESLSAKMRYIFAEIRPLIDTNAENLLIKCVTDFRNAAAHGKNANDIYSPKLQPTIIALMAALIIYDLTTSGLPLERSEIIARWWLETSLTTLIELSN